MAEFVPFGQNGQNVSAFGCLIHIFSIIYFIAKNLLGVFHGFRVISGNFCIQIDKIRNNRHGRRNAAVISPAFECQAENRNLSVRNAFDRRQNSVGHFFLALVIAFNCSFNQTHGNIVLPPHIGHSIGVFWKTTAAISRPRIQKLIANTAVQPHTFGNFINISAGFLTEVGHFIDIMNFKRQKGIGCIFNRFRRAAFDKQHIGFAFKRLIKLFDNRLSLLRISSDNNPVGMKEIMYGKTLAQKFRQRHNIKIRLWILFAN